MIPQEVHDLTQSLVGNFAASYGLGIAFVVLILLTKTTRGGE